jgi:bifunctional non-homologous end joining protein LigD
MLWRTAKPPGLIEPCIPIAVSKPPVRPQWIHEIKYDGYRLIARKRDRRGRYPRISEAVAGLRAVSATIDGEGVWCDDAGIAVFDKLQSRTHDAEAFLYAFDLLELDGEDWRPRLLKARKAELQKVLAQAAAGIEFNEHLAGDGAAICAHACKLGAEGIISKHRERPYRGGPSKAWLKIKNPKAPGVLRFRDPGVKSADLNETMRRKR